MKIAIIDDQKDIRYSVSKVLKKDNHQTFLYSGLEVDVVKSIKENDIDLLIVDIMLSDNFSGIDLLKILRQKNIKQPAILMTAYTTPTNMIEASKIGIKDILQKPFTKEELKDIVNKYVTTSSGQIQILSKNDEEFVGSFETMKDIYKKIGIAANNDLSVIILGDTGTGKELVANLIHKNSLRNKYPIISINCATIPKELFESELFGHEKGAFTGADKKHIGFAEAVKQGTIFFDEIGELDISLQSKLLRFLENKSFKRVGSNIEIPFQGRVVSATNININDYIKNENFREDLFYRLSMLSIEIPNLEKRKDDIPILVTHFIKKANKELKLNIKGISEDALQILKKRQYKGNIRELKNIVYNAALNAHSDFIQIDNLNLSGRKEKISNIEDIIEGLIEKNGIENIKDTLEEIEKIFYQKIINKSNNISKLSEYLNISRVTFRNILKKYGIIKK